jgi:magnesium chelatase subunit D
MTKDVFLLDASNIKRFPFSAVVGLDLAKTALLISVLEPTIGGVLLKGNRGSAKTSLVRGLGALLHDYKNYVELPLSATEDRVVGSIDLESLIKKGKQLLRPGLLAMADDGILYVDEINLLPDYLVDMLLDSAASQINVVERDGVSICHRARFVLVGSMNEEEGMLRPQLLDRFGLCVEVNTSDDPLVRAEAVKRRLEFEKDPEKFINKFKDQEFQLLLKIQNYKPALVTNDVLATASEIVVKLGILSLRTELALVKAARAYSYLKGKDSVSTSELYEVLPLVISHREPKNLSSLSNDLKSQPETNDFLKEGTQRQDLQIAQSANDNFKDFKALNDLNVDPLRFNSLKKQSSLLKSTKKNNDESKIASGFKKNQAGDTELTKIDFYMTAESFAKNKAQSSDVKSLDVTDIKFQKKVSYAKRSIVFLLDVSGSMGATKRITIARNALDRYLIDAYHAKDRVSLITFGDGKAQTLVEATSSSQVALKKLDSVKIGGKTPLDLGLKEAFKLLKKEKSSGYRPHLVVITDGRASQSIDNEKNIWESVEKQAELIKKLNVLTLVVNPSGFAEHHAEKLSSLLGGNCLNVDSEVDPSKEIATLIEQST